ncbi:MAG TPA: AAA family ATPase [Vicinamibacterales bacterium]|nr:AAA family ATPase [Vicinamibacterales bacterium]
MYEEFFGLRERPFELIPNPRFLFLSQHHQEALTHLNYGLSGRPGITLVIGDAGTGKSTLIRAALENAHGDGSRIALMANPTLTRAEFYEALSGALGFSSDAATSKTAFLREMDESLAEAKKTGGIVAVIVDEAQSLPSELLEELRLLTNAGADGHGSLTLVLVGQPELADRLNDPALRQLKQRIALRAELMSLSLKETAGYIASRITIAGGRADQVFTRDAVLAIHAASKGLPRVISVLCDNALVTGFAANVRPVGSAIVADVCKDFDLPRVKVAQVEPPRPAPKPAAPTPVAAPPPQPQPQPSLADTHAAAEVQSSQPAREMFREVKEPRRFSFFRGARG